MAGTSVGEVFKKLALQAGIPKDSPFFYLLDSDTTLRDTLVSDSIMAEFKPEGLMTVEAARQHPEVSKHFRGKYLNDMDREIEKSIEALGFSKEEAEALMADKDSFKKLTSLFKGASSKIADLSAKGDGKMTDEEKRKYIEKINDFPTLLSKKDKEWQDKLDTLQGKLSETENTFERERVENMVNGSLSKFNFADALQKEDYLKLAKDKLFGGDYVVKRKEGALTLANKENPELEYLRDNKKITFDSVLGEIVSPYLAKSTKTDPNAKKTTKIETTPTKAQNPNSVGSFGADKILKRAEEIRQRQSAGK